MRRFRRAVVTGGAGFVGTLVCRRLLEAGTAVVCLDDLVTGTSNALLRLRSWPEFEFRCCDVSTMFAVPGGVDLVIHMETGSRGTRHALELAERTGARFILASADPEPSGLGSDRETMTAVYGRAGRVNAGIARIFGSYGPGMPARDGCVVSSFARQALRGEPLIVSGDGSQTRSLCHVSDIVRGVLLLASSDLAVPVSIGNPEEVTVRQIASRIVAMTGSSSSIRYLPGRPDDRASRPPDISLAESALGFRPRVEWRRGLAETLNWFAQSTQPVAV